MGNSLVGSTAGDRVGYVSDYNTGFTALSNGNYLINSRYWDNSGTADAGAVTWGNGMGGTTGPVSEANSLVGSTPGDQVGYYSNFTPHVCLEHRRLCDGQPLLGQRCHRGRRGGDLG